jgi:hypothetical protein
MPKGALAMLIFSGVLAKRARFMRGYAIRTADPAAVSGDVLDAEERVALSGTPAHPDGKVWAAAEWGTSETGASRPVYRLTRLLLERKQLQSGTSRNYGQGNSGDPRRFFRLA